MIEKINKIISTGNEGGGGFISDGTQKKRHNKGLCIYVYIYIHSISKCLEKCQNRKLNELLGGVQHTP